MKTCLGAIHSVVFGGFAPKELAGRIQDAKPKLIVSASCGLEGKKIIDYKTMLDESLNIANYTDKVKVLIVQRKIKPVSLIPGRDYDYDQAIYNAPTASSVPVEADHPLYILYTSGTTGFVQNTTFYIF